MKKNSRTKFIKKQGFTVIELSVVITVLLIVIVLMFSAFSSFNKKNILDSAINNVFSILSFAKNKTVASEQANQYGVYFDVSTMPNKYILFQGQSYASRNINFDEIHFLPNNLEFASISFAGLGSEVVFSRLDGETDNNGLVSINLIDTDEIKTIYIYSSGEASFSPEIISGVGRIIDSRHVHFDLGWDISGSTTLKFDFVNAGQTKEITMIDYFSIDDFDWAGDFVINNVIQRFEIHTHALSPLTQLCIHRDRDENINDEEVYIYIIQGGVEKNIAHYDDDNSATVNKGNYVWNQMQIQ